MATIDPCNCVGAWTGMHSPACPRGGGFPTPLREAQPTPPAPAMPEEVRALVEHCKADAHFPRHLIAAVEAKYGGSR